MRWDGDLERDGFAWLRGCVPPDRCAEWLTTVAAQLLHAADDPAVLKSADGPAYGARDLLRLWPAGVSVWPRPLAETVRQLLGDPVFVVRGLYFDKPPGHSWALPWHRDFTVAVRHHHPAAGFTKPTIKAGVPHYEAPQAFLETMLTVRIHLDPMTPTNGPLRVVPGSHRTSSEETAEGITLECDAGDVLLIRPLVLHASGHSTSGTTEHRRLLHWECAGVDRPTAELEWDRFEPIA